MIDIKKYLARLCRTMKGGWYLRFAVACKEVDYLDCGTYEVLFDSKYLCKYLERGKSEKEKEMEKLKKHIQAFFENAEFTVINISDNAETGYLGLTVKYEWVDLI